MKKEVKFLIFTAISAVLLASLVAAISPAPNLPDTNQPVNVFQGISDLLTGLMKTVGDVFGMAVGSSPFGLGEDIFARMILFIIVTSVLYWPANVLLKQNKTLSIIVSTGVALLGVRFIDTTLLNAVLLPYSAVTLALSVIVPIALYGIFIYNQDLPSVIRKCGWWILAFCYLALYIWRFPTFAGKVVTASPAPLPAAEAAAQLIYIGGFVLCIVLALLDKWIDARIEELKNENKTLTENFARMKTEKSKLESDYQALLEERNRMIASGTATASSLQDMDNRMNNLLIAMEGMNKSMAAINKTVKNIKPTKKSNK